MGNLKHGWISIHREIQDHWLWNEKPFSKGQAWIDLILLANHQDGKVAFADHVELVPRGTFITSQSKLAQRWGWTRPRVRAFISCLESDQMITIKTTTTSTSISLINYEKYQGVQPTKQTSNSQRTNNERATSVLRACTNNNISNNGNNEKKGATVVPSEQGLPNEDDEWVNSEDIELPEVIE